jgi:hypothetical protein
MSADRRHTAVATTATARLAAARTRMSSALRRAHAYASGLLGPGFIAGCSDDDPRSARAPDGAGSSPAALTCTHTRTRTHTHPA